MARHSVTEFSALPDYITHTTDIEAFRQFSSTPSEGSKPFDLKHLIKAYAELRFHKGEAGGEEQETPGLILSYNSFK